MTGAWLLAAALLPGVFWDHGPETAPALKEAGIARIRVPEKRVEAWKDAGVAAEAFDPAACGEAAAPGVEYRMNEASATRMPWVDANGWRYTREPARSWYCAAKRGGAALAAAEAWAYGVDAVVRPEPADLPALGRMLAFLRGLEGPALPARANIAVVDDGSETTAEVLNLLARRNLLFKVAKAPDPALLNVRIGSPEYPRDEAADAYEVAVKVRHRLTDEKRLLRIFGSEVVLVRLAGDGKRARVHLLNYGRRPVNGLRVRVLGDYRSARLAAFAQEQAQLADWTAAGGAVEFTVPAIDTYAVVDLPR